MNLQIRGIGLPSRVIGQALMLLALASTGCGTFGGTGGQAPDDRPPGEEPAREEARERNEETVTLRVINDSEYPADIDAFMSSARTSLGDVSSGDSLVFDLSRRAALQTGRRVRFRAELTTSGIVVVSEPVFPRSGTLIRWIIHPTGRQPSSSLFVYRSGG